MHTNHKRTDRNDNTTGVAKGDEPETLYMVTSGQHYNAGCCFDVRHLARLQIELNVLVSSNDPKDCS